MSGQKLEAVLSGSLINSEPDEPIKFNLKHSTLYGS